MDIPTSLLDKIAKDKIVIFVGAGVSRSVGLPSWTELINAILDGLSELEPKKDKFKSALADEILTPLEVLTKISLHKIEAIEHLETKIRSYDRVKPSTVHELIGKISKQIITTNYDCLLESKLSDYEKVTYSNNFKVAKLSNYDRYIFKIHGDVHEPDKCILFPDQYENLYGDETSSTVFELKKIISDKSILFIGFSMSDPYISNLFNFISEVYKGFTPEHYIITTDSKTEWPNRIKRIHIESNNDLKELLEEVVHKMDSHPKSDLAVKINVDEGPIIGISENLEYDLPPQNKFWVGRRKELDNLSNDNFKVIFITGIGGQGKSALASYFIRNRFDTKEFELADWRDFKEETNRFQTKLISIIKRITNERITAKQLESASNTELIDLFFKELGSRRIIFVFDNIDSYIDLEEFKPIGGMSNFFEQALKINHRAKFIFTCRPFIREASINFYQLKLSGLSSDECHELFDQYKISIRKSHLKELSEKAYLLTNGHPLWLNLIAAQALRGIQTVNSFIQSISAKSDFVEEDIASILSGKILDSVWNSMNDKQRILLRGIAETVKPETVSNLKKILEPELNNNQFNKSFKVLLNLSLLELKPSSISDDQVELHPLVKEYILSKFPKKDRAKFITLLVKFYDSFIYILKPKLSSYMSLEKFQNWTSKIELQINKDDHESALVALEEVSSSILSAGFCEEYIRVAELLFNKIDWKKAIENEYAYFHKQLTKLTTVLTQFGLYSKCSETLDKYSTLIQGKSTNYLAYCSEKCYLEWYQGHFKEAIEIGEKGVFLITESGIQDNHDLRHNLALAHRDSQIKENIDKALNYFKKNETIDSVINDFKGELGGGFYGNVGKCLEYLGRLDDALRCYHHSISILFEEDNDYSKINLGYASAWIHNLLVKKGEKFAALYFIKFSIDIWKYSSPPRAEKMNKVWRQIDFDKESKKEINKLPDWKIEDYCKNYVKNNTNRQK